MKKNIVLSYKKDGRLNFASITLTTDHANILKLSPDERDLVLEYENEYFKILPFFPITEENIKIGDRLIKLKAIIKANYDKRRNSYKIYIPLGIIKNWNLENKKILDMSIFQDKIVFTTYNQEEFMNVNNDIVNIYSPEYIKEVLSIITVKVEKGGIGKTFFTCSIGTGLALAGYKTLIMTTDPQNNVLDMLLRSTEEADKKIYHSFDKKDFTLSKKTQGLKYWLKNETGEIIPLRENLDYIPLESPLDNNKKFEENIGKLFFKLKESYDFVVIDGVPTKKVDEVILKYTSRFVVPAYGDKLTIQGITRVIKELGVDKLSAIIFNRYEDTLVQKKYYNELKDVLVNTDIYFPEPVKNLSAVTQLIEKSKSIWESENKSIVKIQEIMKPLLIKLIKDCNNQ